MRYGPLATCDRSASAQLRDDMTVRCHPCRARQTRPPQRLIRRAGDRTSSTDEARAPEKGKHRAAAKAQRVLLVSPKPRSIR